MPGPEPPLRLRGRSLHPGTAAGAVLQLDEPLSFWGGVDQSGIVVDAHHPQRGVGLAGTVLALPSGRGSSSSTAVLAELVRSHRAPAALLLAECDTILLVGALVAAEMYGVRLPVVQLPADDLALLGSGGHATVEAAGAGGEATVTVRAR